MSDNTQCDYCGRPVQPSVINGDAYICMTCLRNLVRCAGCTSYPNCAFENDPSPIPKIVTKVFQQGPTVIQTQVKNPERISLFCQKCQCWNAEYEYCRREDDWCNQHQEIPPLFREQRINN